MKKTPREILNKREVALPKKSYLRLLRFILRLMQRKSDVSYEYAFDKNEMRGKQVIILADHATRNAYKYVLYGYPFVDPNVVIGYQNIFVKGLFKLLLKAGIIPKKLYQADPKSVINMLKILKMGGSLCIFPEGIQSASGSTHPIFSGTAALLKKAGVTVVLCKSFGSYLIRPRYKKRENRGHQEFHYEILFEKEELERLSTDEIYEKLLERFRYNDFEWNKTARCKYKAPKNEALATDIDAIIYRCPKCNSEFKLRTEGDFIICENCHNTVLLNEYYDLIPKTENDFMPFSSIDEWFKYQRKLAMEEAKSGFLYEYECKAGDIHNDKLTNPPFYSCGEGTLSLTSEKISYRGTRHGIETELCFDVKNIPSFIFTPALDNYFYYSNEFYSFEPKCDKRRVVKYMLLIEEAHRLIDETWNKISEDVYEE